MIANAKQCRFFINFSKKLVTKCQNHCFLLKKLSETLIIKKAKNALLFDEIPGKFNVLKSNFIIPK